MENKTQNKQTNTRTDALIKKACSAYIIGRLNQNMLKTNKIFEKNLTRLAR